MRNGHRRCRIFAFLSPFMEKKVGGALPHRRRAWP
nr:MAG TPA: hypothetical protein [Caudoviricetes sp.]